jgi:hypothetical protein
MDNHQDATKKNTKTNVKQKLLVPIVPVDSIAAGEPEQEWSYECPKITGRGLD